jgi:flagellar biogenesis protein FliO
VAEEERREEGRLDAGADRLPFGGLAGWLLTKLRRARRARPRLALVERITLAPRQSLSLIEAEGRRLLVATSADGAPAFYPLDEPRYAAAHASETAARSAPALVPRRARQIPRGAKNAPRVSW